ncbi:MAG: hypothetical protein UY22_C0001G0007 [Candidatus Amesbacteria bacterium GW2011_GWC1_48_10]|uniref:Uncharacterized protein n=1 Tax=Candidatus Amesbacteria bacterium GW2011_GWC1_48_10 TaxID=1618365 RepID=A0A0G1WXJ7_9BACT|nr:MAG: hypothetical protein UY22_C0001G0007 [Candidatus Amesbacteria bacterium GW2011_GWC1_48_10]
MILIVISLYIFFNKIFPQSNFLKDFDPKKYGPDCEYVSRCGNIISVNCRAEVDGPFYYVNKKTGEILEYCGGYCMTDDPTGKNGFLDARISNGSPILIKSGHTLVPHTKIRL